MRKRKPILLDLFCGQGGASAGYVAAGFDVVGIDIRPQPRYPFRFYQWDALHVPLGEFDAIHASPPCQRFSTLNNGTFGASTGHPDLIGPIRGRLITAGIPYIIENVPGAPLHDPVTLCGTMFGLGVDGFHLRRHRGFETSFRVDVPPPCDHAGNALGVYGHGQGGAAMRGRTATADQARRIMGMSWANRDGCSQAIPPAYTEWIGRQLIAKLAREGVAA